MWNIPEKRPKRREAVLLLYKLDFMRDYDECYISQSKMLIQTEGFYDIQWYDWSGDELKEEDIIGWMPLPGIPQYIIKEVEDGNK